MKHIIFGTMLAVLMVVCTASSVVFAGPPVTTQIVGITATSVKLKTTGTPATTLVLPLSVEQYVTNPTTGQNTTTVVATNVNSYNPFSYTGITSGLVPNTQYQARSCIVDSVGTTDCSVQITFTTGTGSTTGNPNQTPVFTVTTNSASSITGSSAVLNGTVVGGISANNIIALKFYYTINGSIPTTSSSSIVGVASGASTFNATLTGLNQATPVKYIACATDDSSVTYCGTTASFTTSIIPVIPASFNVVTDSASSITNSQATVQGTVVGGISANNIIATRFYYTTNGNNPTTSSASVIGSVISANSFTGTVSGLSPATVVKYIACATDDSGVTDCGSVAVFTTTSSSGGGGNSGSSGGGSSSGYQISQPPAVLDVRVSAVSSISANFNATIRSIGCPVQTRFEYGRGNFSGATQMITLPASFSTGIQGYAPGLVPGSQYSVRVYVANCRGQVYSYPVSFTTPGTTPASNRPSGTRPVIQEIDTTPDTTIIQEYDTSVFESSFVDMFRSDESVIDMPLQYGMDNDIATSDALRAQAGLPSLNNPAHVERNNRVIAGIVGASLLLYLAYRAGRNSGLSR